MPGFADVLQHVIHAWKERKADVDRAAGELVRAIQAMGEMPGDPQKLGTEVLRQQETSCCEPPTGATVASGERRSFRTRWI